MTGHGVVNTAGDQADGVRVGQSGGIVYHGQRLVPVQRSRAVQAVKIQRQRQDSHQRSVSVFPFRNCAAIQRGSSPGVPEQRFTGGFPHVKHFAPGCQVGIVRPAEEAFHLSPFGQTQSFFLRLKTKNLCPI